MHTHVTLKHGTRVVGNISEDDLRRLGVVADHPDHIEPYTHGWLTGFMTGCIGTCVTLGALWVLL